MIAHYKINPETRMNLNWIAIDWLGDLKTFENYMERFSSSHNDRQDGFYHPNFIQLVKYIGMAVDHFQDVSLADRRRYNRLMAS